MIISGGISKHGDEKFNLTARFADHRGIPSVRFGTSSSLSVNLPAPLISIKSEHIKQ